MIYPVAILMVIVVGIISKVCSLMRWIGSRAPISTGTDVMPEGDYGIVATDVAQLPNAKAVLVSDVINCQVGPAELRFRLVAIPLHTFKE
uniref:Uncharacterized protein n=1 Tax=Parascaris equorum TaxID=6256 RepID=A0A914RN76_PAREQ